MKNRRLVQVAIKKIILLVISVLALSIFAFSAARLAPGDPLQAFYGEQVDRMTVEEHTLAKQRLGLDDPFYIQYEKWVVNAVQGDFGISYKYKEPASMVIRELLPNTLILSCLSFIIIFGMALLIALCCARYEETWIDKLFCKAGTVTYYLPAFWVALLMILIFNVNLGWLPGSGAYDPGQGSNIGSRFSHLILPVMVMVLGHVWYYAYMIRNKLLDEVRQEYVLLAKAKGLSRWRVLCKHCLRNVWPTIISMMAVSANHILGGTYVVEAVFAYPGIGNLAIESAKYHDYNLLMLIVLITGMVVIASGIVSQLLNEAIDPRMKHKEGESVWRIIHPSNL